MILNLLLMRREFTDKSTIGQLSIDGVPYCATLELPWRDNQQGISCIPEGDYQVVVDWSASKQKRLPHVLNVPGRDGIRIHTGNYPHEIQGCILVGEKTGNDAIWNSLKMFVPLLEKLEAAGRATLTIRKEE
jgi:hypothetical protein